jgi:histidinol-phosphate aminotransferase
MWVQTLAQTVAIAALGDTNHVRLAIDHNAKWLSWLKTEIAKFGLVVTPSEANFLLIHFVEAPNDNAASAYEFLLQQGVILRTLNAYGLPQSLRLSVGTEEANRALIQALDVFLALGQ